MNEDEKFYYIDFPEKTGQKTVATNRKHTGDIRILEYEWIRENCNKPFIVKVNNQVNRTQPVPNKTLQNIKKEMKKLSAKNVTHVHKYVCPTSLKTKYCNAIINKKGNKDLENSVTIMKGDQITEDWLYQTAVGLNECQQWFNEVTDPAVNNRTFEVPVASAKQNIIQPKRDMDSPTVTYTQNNQGICGISAFSSAFAYSFDKDLALLIYKKRQEYLESLSISIRQKSKRSASMKFIMQIVFRKEFKNYGVKRIKQMIKWSDLLHDNRYFNSIMLCILKSEDNSRDHIVAITKGWIFDGNLTHALSLTVGNLTWCCSTGKSNNMFIGFYEQVQIHKYDTA